MANEKMTLRGFKENSGTLSGICDIQCDQPFSATGTGSTHFGMPIDRNAAKMMISDFYKQFGGGAVGAFKDVKLVDFSKASIFRILSQEGCEYIRFFFGIADLKSNKASLIMEGLDINCEPIGGKGIQSFDKDNEEDPGGGQYEEKGNGLNNDGEGQVVISLHEEWMKLFSSNIQVMAIASTEQDPSDNKSVETEASPQQHLNKLMSHVYEKMSKQKNASPE